MAKHSMNRSALERLLAEVRACRACEKELPLGPRPVLRASELARILVVGQAPGTRVHATGIPWNDPSGDRLRRWMGVSREAFYDERRIAIIPMGFCYPGKGKTGDLPPRKECAKLWLEKILSLLPRVEMTILCGQYAHAYYLKESRHETLTETVRYWRDYFPRFLPLPHPSPRNTFWLQRRPWFEKEIIPVLQGRVRELMGTSLLPLGNRN